MEKFKNLTYRCKGEILTPVHVGSGRVLQNGVEFFIDDKSKKVGKADHHKILQVIGRDEIQWWTNAIMQRESIWKKLHEERKKNLEDVCTEILLLKSKETKDQLREHIRNPYTGNPIIPGSSIKGAIRTALITQRILKDIENNDTKIQKFIDELKALKFKDDNEKKKCKKKLEELDKQYIQTLTLIKDSVRFDPQKDIFKFLKISDAEIPLSQLHVDIIKTLNLSKYKDSQIWKIKQELSTLIECVTGNFECKITIDKRFFLENPLSISNFDNFIGEINSYTKNLVELLTNPLENKERTFENISSEEEIKIKKIKRDIRNEIENINNNKEKNICVFRMSYGSGWNFMTGGWLKKKGLFLPNEWKNFLALLVKDDAYLDFPFPKTRRLLSDYSHPGFVKLTFERVDE